MLAVEVPPEEQGVPAQGFQCQEEKSPITSGCENQQSVCVPGRQQAASDVGSAGLNGGRAQTHLLCTHSLGQQLQKGQGHTGRKLG